MKIALLFTFMACFPAAVLCQQKIPLDSVSAHMGENVTVCARVYGTKALQKVTFINLGAAYPNSPLTLDVFAKDRGKFTSPPEELYKGRNVCATGILKEYNGRPEIIISSQDAIEIEK